MLRAYEGDKVQIRTLVGAHMSPHYFTVHGVNWLFEPTDFDAADNTSGYRGTQGMGISEHYEVALHATADQCRERRGGLSVQLELRRDGIGQRELGDHARVPGEAADTGAGSAAQQRAARDDRRGARRAGCLSRGGAGQGVLAGGGQGDRRPRRPARLQRPRQGRRRWEQADREPERPGLLPRPAISTGRASSCPARRSNRRSCGPTPATASRSRSRTGCRRTSARTASARRSTSRYGRRPRSACTPSWSPST